MTLITAGELADVVKDVHLLDVRYYMTEPARGRAEYDAGHIRGAVFVDLDSELAAPPRPDGAGGRHRLPSTESFQATVRRWGLRDGADVVVYDQGNSLAAGRAWWVLTDAGVRVRVLDGGWAAWVAQGLPISTVSPQVDEGDIICRPGHLGVADASDVVGRGDARLIDVRSAERYAGQVEPIDRIPGHIPGAQNIPATTLFLGDGRFASPEQIRAVFGELSADDILSCGSGITAAQAALAAAHAGLPIPRVYIGSYSDWISDPARPVERD